MFIIYPSSRPGHTALPTRQLAELVCVDAEQNIIAGELPKRAFEGGTCSTADDIGRVISLSQVLYVCLKDWET